MNTLFQPLILILVVATVMLVGIGAISWRFRPKPGARSLAGLMATTSIWAAGSILSLLSVGYEPNLAATWIAYVGISLVPITWLFLSLEYAGKKSWLTYETAGKLLIVPLLTLGFAMTNEFHRLMWHVDGLTMHESFQVLKITGYGPWFWIHTTYSYFLLAAGTVIFLRAIVRSQRIYRRQVALTVAAIAIPWLGNAIGLLKIFSFTLDPTPFLFVFSGGLFLVAFFRYGLLDIAPIARDTVMEEMSDGVIVLDEDDHVIDVNAAAETLLEFESASVVGQRASEVFYSEYVERYWDVYDGSEQIDIDISGTRRTLDLRISPLHGRNGQRRGRVVIIQDITVEEEQRQRLEQQNRQLKQQNDQLEQFANIVSHDLQNPLSRAIGYLELVSDEYESEYLARIESAHEDMNSLIDNLLTLARQGKVVGEFAPVPLESVVEASRSHVPDDSTVVIEGELDTVDGDPARLQQLLQNLFKNAVEHGSEAPLPRANDETRTGESEPTRPDSDESTGVTITVGMLEDRQGFYVADDGPGIPPEKRDRIFESGYTDSSSGTGLGLAIVQNVASAHGWDISVVESDTGGARFEFEISTFRQESRTDDSNVTEGQS